MLRASERFGWSIIVLAQFEFPDRGGGSGSESEAPIHQYGITERQRCSPSRFARSELIKQNLKSKAKLKERLETKSKLIKNEIKASDASNDIPNSRENKLIFGYLPKQSGALLNLQIKIKKKS